MPPPVTSVSPIRAFPPAEIELGAQAARTSLLRNAHAPDTPTERNRKPKRRIVRRFHTWRRREAYRRRYRLFLAHHRLARLATANRYSVLFRFHQTPSPIFRLPEFFSIIRKTFRGLDVNCFSARERLIARMDEMEEIDGCDSCQIIREQM